MTWNHRVVFDAETDLYGIHEVYYSEDGTPMGATVNPVTLGHVETRQDLQAEIAQIMNAFALPTLNSEIFKESEDDDQD